MNVNIERTKDYYNRYKEVCKCDACQNYIKNISEKYPFLEDYLSSIAVDIRIPFETMWFENNDNHTILYQIVQYVVIGKWEKDLSFKLNDLTLSKSDCHPTVNIDDDFFVIDICGINLFWGLEIPFSEAFPKCKKKGFLSKLFKKDREIR